MKWFFLLVSVLLLLAVGNYYVLKQNPNYQCLGLVKLDHLSEINYPTSEGLEIYETYAKINGKTLKLLDGKDWSTGKSLDKTSPVYLFSYKNLVGIKYYFLGSSDEVSVQEWNKQNEQSMWLCFFYFCLTFLVFWGIFFIDRKK